METRGASPPGPERISAGTCGTPCLHSTLTSCPNAYAAPLGCGTKTVVPVFACSNATSLVAPKLTATVQFCVFALSGFTAAASWWYGFHSSWSRYQLNLVALTSMRKYSAIFATTFSNVGESFFHAPCLSLSFAM